ncbi:MAG: 16S rRNA processing protein RimM [Oscillospiraceae bacterium]|nr:16S rRNA processing protein RimM [Oscillospiraceae bacterium]
MNETYLEAGKIVSTHGIRGEVKVLPWADSPEFLTRFKTFYLVKPSPSGEGVAAVKAVTDEGRHDTKALSVESSRVQKSCVLIKFKGVDTVEDAQKLRDRVISIARDDPRIPAGTVFQADLIGMPVYADGAEIGRITEILSMPASDVWVVKGEKEYMIPNVKAFVPEIDLSLGRVDVKLIEGMQTDEN